MIEGKRTAVIWFNRLINSFTGKGNLHRRRFCLVSEHCTKEYPEQEGVACVRSCAQLSQTMKPHTVFMIRADLDSQFTSKILVHLELCELCN